MKRKTKPEINAFDRCLNVGSIVSEHFEGYVVIGLDKKQGMVWKYSERNLAVGLMTRLLKTIETDDRIVREEPLPPPPDNEAGV